MQPTAVPSSSALPGSDVEIRPGMPLPMPDDAAAASARERLTSIDIGVSAPTIAALGSLSEAVVFVAGVQGTPYWHPEWQSPRVCAGPANRGTFRCVALGPATRPEFGNLVLASRYSGRTAGSMVCPVVPEGRDMTAATVCRAGVRLGSRKRRREE